MLIYIYLTCICPPFQLTSNINKPEMSHITRNQSQKYGPLWELNPRPLAPKARIIPLDQTAVYTIQLDFYT